MNRNIHPFTLVVLSILANTMLSHAKENTYFNEAFARDALITNKNIYKEGEDHVKFWNSHAKNLDWFEKWHTTLKWDSPHAQWFVGGKLNVSYNCLDRHIQNGNGNKVAFYYKNEEGKKRIITYSDMFIEVNKLANVLKSMGISKGDRVAIYMPLMPESIAAMLACTRIGAIHTVIFGGIGVGAVEDRIQDAQAKALLTVDGSLRAGKLIPYKKNVDTILSKCPSIEKVLVLQNLENHTVEMKSGRDFWYKDKMKTVENYCEPEKMDSEDPLFILYTSGTTGKPKGILHTTAGYLLGVHMTYQWVFDTKPDDVYWCTADIGWITGHSYVVYGPMSNCATQVLYDGSFAYPKKNVFSEIIDEFKVNIFYTAPTLIRLFMKWGSECLEGANLKSLRLLGSIGEPINPETWQWFYKHVGHEKCPIVDTWFQTETGAFVISPLPGVTALKPGSITQALPGYDVAILDEHGNESSRGYLAIRKPFPSMMRGVYNDPSRYISTYWEKWQNRYYYAGDHAQIDNDGYIWIGGRSDEVIKVSGHRIGTAEIENALLENKMVAEAGVVGVHDDITGSAIIAFVVLKNEYKIKDDIEQELKQTVTKYMGAYARPRHIVIVKQLPKNRSGKIVRRILKNAVEQKDLGNMVTLFNKESLPDIINKGIQLNQILYKQDKTDYAYQQQEFKDTLNKGINKKWDNILAPIKQKKHDPAYNYTLVHFGCEDHEIVQCLSHLIRDNFSTHPVFDDVPQDIKDLYCNANTKEGLISVLEKEHTYGVALKANDEYIGACIMRFNECDDDKPFMHIKRMHAFYNVSAGRFAGIGKTLINTVATAAQIGGVDMLFTTAPYPIKGYFEHLGWQGHMIYTNFILHQKTINLQQFKCHFILPEEFKGF
ncbi:MAG: acetate--CoA ligase [Candidatus Dependentiae bacterium]